MVSELFEINRVMENISEVSENRESVFASMDILRPERQELPPRLEHSEAEATEFPPRLEHSEAEATEFPPRLEHSEAEATEFPPKLEHSDDAKKEFDLEKWEEELLSRGRIHTRPGRHFDLRPSHHRLPGTPTRWHNQGRFNVSFKGRVELEGRIADVKNAKNDVQKHVAEKRLAEQLAKEEKAKQDYREKLYGKNGK